MNNNRFYSNLLNTQKEPKVFKQLIRILSCLKGKLTHRDCSFSRSLGGKNAQFMQLNT